MLKDRSNADRRLNPFAFPAETNVRFTLLIFTAIMLAFSMSILLWITLDPEQTDRLTDPLTAPAPDAPMDEFLDQAQQESSSLAVRSLQYLAYPIILVVGVFLLAAIIYANHPWRIRRRKGLVPLAPEADRSFQSEIRSLAQGVGILAPGIELGQDRRSSSGQAFGAGRRYVIGLGGGARLLWRKNASAFRALVLHELAHIANGDVRRTYFAQALWYAVLGLTIVPLFIALLALIGRSLLSEIIAGSLDGRQLVTQTLPTFAVLILQGAGTIAFAYAIWASLLRAREIYADWRAARWGVEAPLTGMLEHTAAREKRTGSRGWRRLHPTARQRLAALREPASLFRITPDLPLLAGVLLGILATGLVTFVLPGALAAGAGLGAWAVSLAGAAHETGSASQANIAYLILLASYPILALVLAVPILSLGYLVAGTVGLQMQREAVADLAYRRRVFAPYLRLLAPSVLVALGLEIGFLIVPFALFSPFGLLLGGTITHPLQLSITLLSILGATGLTWMGLVYTRFFARRLLGAHPGAAPPKGKRRLLTWAASGVFLVLYAPLLVMRMVGLYAPDPGTLAFGAALLPLGIFLYGVAFGGTWLLVGVMRLLGRLRCPVCGQETRARIAVGAACENCGRDLAPWLFAASATTRAPG